MKCRYCHNEVEDDSVFCRYCGERLARVRRKKQTEKPTAPKPHRLASGEWAAQVMISGRRQTVKGATEADYYAKAEALKAGVIAARAAYKPLTVGQMIDAYIERNRPVLSPSTVKAYSSMRKHRFQGVMQKDVRSGIDWQMEINRELKDVKPKTLANAWRLITAAMKDAEIPEPRVKLPKIPKRDRPWLDYDQIFTFLAEVYENDEGVYLPILLALHGLRRSEIMALTAEDIDLTHKEIHVHAAEVYNDDGKRVLKETTKSRAGTRTVPFMIPGLDLEMKGKTGRLVTLHPNVIYARINRICKRAGLPEVGIHGLRHSFASLAYHLGWSEATTMQIGGWDDLQTVHGVYTHLAAQDKSADVERMKAYYMVEET